MCNLNALALAAAAAMVFAGPACPPACAEAPHWIWTASADGDQMVEFRRSFDVRPHLTSAELVTACRYTSLEVRIDNQHVFSRDAFAPLTRVDIAEHLRAGTRNLTVMCLPCSGPSGFFLALRLGYADGTSEEIITNGAWACLDEGNEGRVSQLSPVSERLLTPREARVNVAATDNYEQWKHALNATGDHSGGSFDVAAGFDIQQLRVAAPEEDSWVSLAFDPQGRAVVAMEQQGLLRMTLNEGGASVKRVERIDNTLKECRGLLFVGDDLYANANNDKALCRLRGDGRGGYGKPMILFTTTGGVGHGRNSLALGPDGKIYSIHGDSVGWLTQATDLTSPSRDARRGTPTREGHVIRMDPKTLAIETVTAGLRNPFGIAFHRNGDMFTYDADAEFDMGAPWYRPTRVSHLVVGGDYGWRGVTGSWPPYYPDHPDNALPSLDIGKGSPTAVKFGTRSNFPPRYRDALFVLDWTYGRILVVHTEPRGASYLCAAETFLQGRPLNVTGLDFGPDGSLYVVTGGRKTQSVLYRIRYVGPPATASGSAHPYEERCSAFAARARQQRRRFEAMLGKSISHEQLLEAWNGLGNADPWIRHAARNVVEMQPVDSWRQAALSESDRLRALTALMTLARSARRQDFPAIVQRLNVLDMASASINERLMMAYTYVLCLPSIKADAELTQSTTQRLSTIYPDREYAVNQRLSEVLAELNSGGMVPTTIDLLKRATRQHEQMHYLYILRHVTRGWSPELRRHYFTALAQSRQYLAGQGMQGFLDKIREDSLATLSAEERATYAGLLAESESSEQRRLPPRPFVRKWNVATLLDAIGKHSAAPDPKRGTAMFTAAGCAMCHRVGGVGTLIGPDLTGASRRYSRRDLLESIVDPSRVIAENYRSLQIVTTAGKTWVGRPVSAGDYRSPMLRLATDPSKPFHVTEIPKAEIEQQRESPISWMPTGLLDTLDAGEVRDLLAFIEAGGKIE